MSNIPPPLFFILELIDLQSSRRIGLIKSNNLNNDIVRFIPRQSLESLREYTFAADIGFSLDKPISQNYRWSLPNKLFDYWQAGIPVVSSNLIEVSKLIKSTEAGIITADNSVKSILEAVKNLSKIKNYQTYI